MLSPRKSQSVSTVLNYCKNTQTLHRLEYSLRTPFSIHRLFFPIGLYVGRQQLQVRCIIYLGIPYQHKQHILLVDKEEYFKSKNVTSLDSQDQLGKKQDTLSTLVHVYVLTRWKPTYVWTCREQEISVILEALGRQDGAISSVIQVPTRLRNGSLPFPDQGRDLCEPSASPLLICQPSRALRGIHLLPTLDCR